MNSAEKYCHTHVDPKRVVTEVKSFRWFLAGAACWMATSAIGVEVASSSTESAVTHVWTEPSSGIGFLDRAVMGARHSIDLSMYELADPTLERDLVARAAAGVDVQVLLDSDFNGARDNAASFALLHARGVHVTWASPKRIFHAKYLVVDGHVAYIGTGNLASRDYATTRDFWVEDASASDVHAIAATFSNDVAHGSAPPLRSGGLLWSPGSTSVLVNLIGGARRSGLVENEEMDSPEIEQALDAAAARGVDVKVVFTTSSEWTTALQGLASDGVHVRVLGPSQVYIHAKVICVDCNAAAGSVFIGSQNFSTSSLSYNRELGVVTSTPAAKRAVASAVDADYAHGTSVIATTPTTASISAVSITAFEASITRGREDSLGVHSVNTDDTCTLRVVLPSGYVSRSRGLGVRRTNSAGNVIWTWEIGANTDPGTAQAMITCGAGSVRRDFTIT